MSEDYSKHYIQNDALCPLPRSGPRVTVGFWIGPLQSETKPELSGGPMFTITYPIGEVCYNWKHMTGDPQDPLHANSARNIAWVDGHLRFEQSTEFACRPNLARISEPNLKTAHWELFQDNPPELWGRILATHELTDMVIREKSALCFSAADGHFIGLDAGDAVTCEKRLPDASCYFTARFPHYVWDPEGGRGDREGSFYLQAANGCFLRVEEGLRGKTLRADATRLEEADLLTATIADGMISLAASEGWTLQHEPPYGELHLITDPDATWAWFTASYA